MMSGFEIDAQWARSWVEDSLLQGSVLACGLVGSLDGASYWLLGAGSVDGDVFTDPDFERSGGFAAEEVERDLSAAVDSLAALGALGLLVEDDSARRGDPVRRGPVAYVGDRMVRWCAIDDTERVSALLRSAAYPLNAMVVSRDPVELACTQGHDLEVSSVNGAIMALIVAAFDAETYLVTLLASRPDKQSRSSGESVL
jgi:hypothetical protein